ncbi:unnamed protein product [Alopecurus aequalis]
MDGGTQPPPPPSKTEGETLPPPAEMGDETQPPAAEVDGETRQPPTEIEGDTQQPSPLSACVSKVLDDDNLLPQIIVRVGFPTSLVHASAVCRRWFGLASGRAFLRRFRELHSPRLLGFYLAQIGYPLAAARFFPMLPQPPPPELDSVVRRANFSLPFYEGAWTDMVGCWNGRVVTSCWNGVRNEFTFVLHSLLCSARGMTRLPALLLQFQTGRKCVYRQFFFREEADVICYFYVMVEYTREGKSVVQVFMLRNGDDSWRIHLTLTMDYLIYAQSVSRSLLVDNKIYMASDHNEIFVLDLTTSSFSTIELPQGVDFDTIYTTVLSCTDDASTMYLIHVKVLQLHIWLHDGDKWLLMETICLRELCAPFLEDDPTAPLRINHAGDYTADFLFLEMGRFALYLNVKCRTLRKVYEMTSEDRHLGCIYPFMMIWPPIFPALKDVPASNAT